MWDELERKCLIELTLALEHDFLLPKTFKCEFQKEKKNIQTQVTRFRSSAYVIVSLNNPLKN